MCNRAKRAPVKMPFFSKFSQIIILLVFVSVIYLVFSFKPLTKNEHIDNYEKLNENVEPFRKNLSECARQVKASAVDVQNFLKKIPQSTMQGKCFVACILKRNEIITKNKINREHLLDNNKEVYGEDSEVLRRLEAAIQDCEKEVEDIFEICEYASIFNDCMHIQMEHMLDKTTMERRMEALGQLARDRDDSEWNDDDEMLKLVRDEL